MSMVLLEYMSRFQENCLIIEFNNYINKIINNQKILKKINIKNISVSVDRVNEKSFILSNFNKINNYLVKDLLEELKKNFKYIIIDFSEKDLIINKKFWLEKANLIFFLVEPCLISIQKSTEILEIYINDYFLDKNKIEIVINKTNKNIPKQVYEEFSAFKIIKEIIYDEEYMLFVNSGFRKLGNIKEYEILYKEVICQN